MRYEMDDVVAVEIIIDHTFVMFWDGAVYCSHQNLNLRELPDPEPEPEPFVWVTEINLN